MAQRTVIEPPDFGIMPRSGPPPEMIEAVRGIMERRRVPAPPGYHFEGGKLVKGQEPERISAVPLPPGYEASSGGIRPIVVQQPSQQSGISVVPIPKGWERRNGKIGPDAGYGLEGLDLSLHPNETLLQNGGPTNGVQAQPTPSIRGMRSPELEGSQFNGMAGLLGPIDSVRGMTDPPSRSSGVGRSWDEQPYAQAADILAPIVAQRQQVQPAQGQPTQAPPPQLAEWTQTVPAPSGNTQPQLSQQPANNQMLQDATRLMGDRRNSMAPRPPSTIAPERDEVASLDAQRQQLMQPEGPRGAWTTLLESFLGRFGAGDVNALPKEREAKRMKALQMMNARQGELEGREAGRKVETRQARQDQEAFAINSENVNREQRLDSRMDRLDAATLGRDAASLERDKNTEAYRTWQMNQAEAEIARGEAIPIDTPDGKFIIRIGPDGQELSRIKVGEPNLSDQYMNVTGVPGVYNTKTGTYNMAPGTEQGQPTNAADYLSQAQSPPMTLTSMIEGGDLATGPFSSVVGSLQKTPIVGDSGMVGSGDESENRQFMKLVNQKVISALRTNPRNTDKERIELEKRFSLAPEFFESELAYKAKVNATRTHLTGELQSALSSLNDPNLTDADKSDMSQYANSIREALVQVGSPGEAPSTWNSNRPNPTGRLRFDENGDPIQ